MSLKCIYFLLETRFDTISDLFQSFDRGRKSEFLYACQLKWKGVEKGSDAVSLFLPFELRE